MKLLLTAKITPDVNNFVLLEYVEQEQHSSLHVRYSFTKVTFL